MLQASIASIGVSYADADEAETSLLVMNLVQFPQAARQYTELGTSMSSKPPAPVPSHISQGQDAQTRFAYEHPALTDHEALEPTSGRKAWMLRHGKRIKKVLKKDKRGYIGS